MPSLHTHLEGTVSQFFYLGPSFYFMTKKRETFYKFCKIHFRSDIKQKLRPK